MSSQRNGYPHFFVILFFSVSLLWPVDFVLSVWAKIMIPVYRLWLHGLYGLHGPSYLLSEKGCWNYTHWSVPSHYLHQCWNIVNWTFHWKIFQWNVDRNSNIYIQENPFENVVPKVATILSRPHCVNWLAPGGSLWHHGNNMASSHLNHQVR